MPTSKFRTCAISITGVDFLLDYPLDMKVFFKIRLGNQKFTSKTVTAKSLAFGSCASQEVATFLLTPHSFIFSFVIVDIFKAGFFKRTHIGRAHCKLVSINLTDQSSSDRIALQLESYKLSDSPTMTSLLTQKSHGPTGCNVNLSNGNIFLSVAFIANAEWEAKAKVGTAISDVASQEMLEEIEKFILSEKQLQNTQSSSSNEEQFSVYSQLEDFFSLSVFKDATGLQAAKSIIREVAQGYRIPKKELLENVKMLEKIYTLKITRSIERRGKPITEEMAAFIASNQTKKAWKMVKSSFGWKGIFFFSKNYSHLVSKLLEKLVTESSKFQKNERQAIIEALEIMEEDLLVCQVSCDQKVPRPNYYIIDDRAEKQISLCFRGTISVCDVVLDLLYQYHEWKNGYVHYGVYKASCWCMNNLANFLVAEAKSRGYKTICVVGHSLGGAVASVFSIMLLECQNLLDGIDVQCFAFAPLPAISEELFIYQEKEALWKKHIHCIVYGNDVVPSLCLGSVIQLKNILIALSEGGGDEKNTCCTLSPSMTTITDRVIENRMLVIQKEEYPLLFVPGTIIHLVEAAAGGDKEKAKFEAWEVDKKVYSEICLRGEYVSDHLFVGCEAALEYFRTGKCVE